MDYIAQGATLAAITAEEKKKSSETRQKEATDWGWVKQKPNVFRIIPVVAGGSLVASAMPDRTTAIGGFVTGAFLSNWAVNALVSDVTQFGGDALEAMEEVADGAEHQLQTYNGLAGDHTSLLRSELRDKNVGQVVPMTEQEHDDFRNAPWGEATRDTFSAN